MPLFTSYYQSLKERSFIRFLFQIDGKVEECRYPVLNGDDIYSTLRLITLNDVISFHQQSPRSSSDNFVSKACFSSNVILTVLRIQPVEVLPGGNSSNAQFKMFLTSIGSKDCEAVPLGKVFNETGHLPGKLGYHMRNQTVIIEVRHVRKVLFLE